MTDTVRSILNDPVTTHMRTDPTRLKVGLTVAGALDYVRKTPTTGRVVYFYVVDDDDRLKGVVPTRRLLMAEPATPVEDVMIRQVVAIPQSATVLDACEFFTLHKLLAFPVVDDQKRLIGLVDVDLYTEELIDLDRQEGTDDLFLPIDVPWGRFAVLSACFLAAHALLASWSLPDGIAMVVKGGIIVAIAIALAASPLTFPQHRALVTEWLVRRRN